MLKLKKANDAERDHIDHIIDGIQEHSIIESKQQYINNCIKNINDCIEVLKIQMTNNEQKINEIYNEVIEKANKYKEIALNTTSQVYETKFAVLNIKLNKFKKILQKIHAV